MNQRILTGLEHFIGNLSERFTRRRLGLLANPASVDHRYVHAAELIAAACPGCLTTLFSPQHGFFADKQDNMIESNHTVDKATGLTVYSLYSDTRIPTREMFDTIDTLLVDLQDVGTRVYTFMYTLSYCLEAAARFGCEVIVLDRPNPIGGTVIEGNVLEESCASFVGRYPIPMRHGLTMGELALLFNTEFGIGCRLTVVPMKGWKRSMLFGDTGLPWIAPSPNLPTPASTAVYPGQVIIEGTNLSEGRGTTLPFELVGAPFLDHYALKKQLEDSCPGVLFRPVFFEPTSGKWQKQTCRGFQIHVTSASDYRPYATALRLIQAVQRLHPNRFEWKQPPYEYEYTRRPIDLILGSKDLRKELESGADVDQLEASWQPGLDRYRSVKRRYHLYE